MGNRPAAFPANQTVGMHGQWSGEQSLQRGMADQATGVAGFQEKQPRVSAELVSPATCIFRSLEAASRSIWGRYARLSQWARRPRAVGCSVLPINRHSWWPNFGELGASNRPHFRTNWAMQIRGFCCPCPEDQIWRK